MNLAKTNIVLAVVAGALAVPTALTWMAEKDRFVEPSSAPLVYDGLDPDKVNLIGFGEPAPGATPDEEGKIERRRIVVRRQGDGWVLAEGELAGAPVKTPFVEKQFLTFMQELRASEEQTVVENASAEQLEEYELTPTTARVLSLQQIQGNQRVSLAELYIGKSANESRAAPGSIQGHYVRDSKRNDILLYEVNYWQPSLDPQWWIDPVLFDLEEGGIQEIKWRSAATGGEFLTFRRREDEPARWQVVANAPGGAGPVRQGELARIVSNFSLLQAHRFEMPVAQIGKGQETTGLQNPAVEVVLTLEDGTTHTVRFGERVGNSAYYYAVHAESGSPAGFAVSVPRRVVRPFERDPGELFDPR